MCPGGGAAGERTARTGAGTGRAAVLDRGVPGPVVGAGDVAGVVGLVRLGDRRARGERGLAGVRGVHAGDPRSGGGGLGRYRAVVPDALGAEELPERALWNRGVRGEARYVEDAGLAGDRR